MTHLLGRQTIGDFFGDFLYHVDYEINDSTTLTDHVTNHLTAIPFRFWAIPFTFRFFEPQHPFSDIDIKMTDEDFVERESRLAQSYEWERLQSLIARQTYQRLEQQETNISIRQRWQAHRAEHPDCDCERCRIYRGEMGAEAEDSLGW